MLQTSLGMKHRINLSLSLYKQNGVKISVNSFTLGLQKFNLNGYQGPQGADC